MAKNKIIQALFRPVQLEQTAQTGQAAASASQTAAAPQPVATGIPGEVVAAISGAVAVLCGEQAQVVSITKAVRERGARPVWAQAAIADNTRPF